MEMEKDEDQKTIEAFSWEEVLSQMGGVRGAVLSGIPVVTFLVCNLKSFKLAAIVSTVVAIIIFFYQVFTKQKLTSAITGLLGVVISVLIAARTGRSSDYYLMGIISTYLYAAVFLVSVFINKPLVGYIRYNGFLPEFKNTWKNIKEIRRLMILNTLLWGLLFLMKGLIQTFFYHSATTLGIVKLLTGYPLTVLLALITYLIVKKSDSYLPIEK